MGSLSRRRRATSSDSGLLSRLATEGIRVCRTRRAYRASPGMEKDGALVSTECDGEARLAITNHKVTITEANSFCTFSCDHIAYVYVPHLQR